MLQLVKVGQLSLNVRKLFFQSAAHRCTRLQAVSPQIHETANFAKFESQALDAADECQRLNIAFCVLTESTLRSRVAGAVYCARRIEWRQH